VTSICALVVNFNGERLLDPCLTSIEACLAEHRARARVVVVDNGSTDGSLAMLRRRGSAIEIVERNRNDGFGAGVNAGVASCDEEWLLLVNNDMTLEPRALERMLDAVTDDPRIGSVGPQIRFSADERVINSAGMELDVLGIARDRLVGRPVEEGGAETREVFGVSAGAALYRRAMLADIGGFDASFFLYLEDVDVAWRARARGWKALYVPDAVAIHRHSATARHGSASKHFYVGRNRVRMLAKNATRAQLLRHGPRMVLHDLLHSGYAAMAGRTLAPLRGRIAGLRDWRAYRPDDGGPAAVALAPPAGLRAALARNRTWRRYSASTVDTSSANASVPRAIA
jgi:GT2 family glycosyltransferase